MQVKNKKSTKFTIVESVDKTFFCIRMRAIFHNIRSMHNVGSMFRTADGAGVEKVYLTGITPAPVDEWGRMRPQVTKVSLGAERAMPWEKRISATQVIKELKKEGYTIIAIEQNKEAIFLAYFWPDFCKSKLHSKFCHGKIRVALEKFEKFKKLEKLVLVVGNEVRGLSPAVLTLADHIVEIPMRGKKESLNVAVAFGIAAYWFLLAGSYLVDTYKEKAYHGII